MPTPPHPPTFPLQALVDISADAGWLDTALSSMVLVQCFMQVGVWVCPSVRYAVESVCLVVQCCSWGSGSGSAVLHAGGQACLVGAESVVGSKGGVLRGAILCLSSWMSGLLIQIKVCRGILLGSRA